MPFQTEQATAQLNAMFNASTWPTWTAAFASLHSTTLALSVTSGGGGEVTGGSYTRQELSFGNAADGQIENDVAVEFASMPATTVYTFAINTSSSEGGTLVWQGTLTASKAVAAGETLRFIVGAIDGVST